MPSLPQAPARPRARGAIATALILLVLTGLGVRLHGVTEPLVSFHPLRHYRSAIIARACYDDHASGVPDWARRIAEDNRDLQQAGEPPLMEWAACAAYRVAGGERLAIPRALAAIAWVIGAFPLFLLARRFMADVAALLAATIYLFAPYGILATRTFQPDPLMTMCSLWGALGAARFGERRTGARLAAAAVLVALALFVKPMSVFVVVPAAIALVPPARRVARLPVDRDALVLVALAFIPAVLYYGYGMVFGTLVRDQFHMRFVPALLPTAFFWHGWLTQIVRVVGWPVLAGGLLATVGARDARMRRLLAACWLGYAAFAVAFTYHIPTHDYYHLPYLAVFALAAGALVDAARRWAGARGLGVLAAGLVAVVAGWGAIVAWPRLTIAGAERRVATYEHIGDLTHHDARVLFLDLEYGYPLMYHGQMSGDTWPDTDDLAAERIGGAAAIGAAGRFDRDYADWHPHYFVVTDLDSFDAETDLQQLLADRAELVEKGSDYRVYRFRGGIGKS